MLDSFVNPAVHNVGSVNKLRCSALNLVQFGLLAVTITELSQSGVAVLCHADCTVKSIY